MGVKGSWQAVMVLLGVLAVAQPLVNTPVEAQLDPFFYISTCPQVYPIVAKGVYQAIQNETRIAASLLRLHFHDCFVQGCDASILLDDTATNQSEKSARPNQFSIRGYEVIDTIKASLESACPGVVSCADTVTLASFFSVVLSGGPVWWVPLGRRDSPFSNFTDTIRLPGPASNISVLFDRFQFQNLSVTDLVALSGSHTIGLSRCVSFSGRLFSPVPGEPALNATLADALKVQCPLGGDGNKTVPMDLRTPTVFDNLYYKNLLESKGLFQSDQVLFNSNNQTRALVLLYAANQTRFFHDFAVGMIHMGNLRPLTGTRGEVRRKCSVSNTVAVPEAAIAERASAGERESERRLARPLTEELTEESAREFFRHVLRQVAEELVEEELQKMRVEDAVTEGHSSM